MRRIDRIIPNSVINNPAKSYLLRGRNLVTHNSHTITNSGENVNETWELGTLSYALRKENEAMVGYLNDDVVAKTLPPSLIQFFNSTIDSNERHLQNYYKKCRLQMKYDNSQPIGIFCEFAYVSAKNNGLTQEYFDGVLRQYIDEKLEYASRQNLIDLVTAMVDIDVSPEDPTFTRAVVLLEAKLAVFFCVFSKK